MTNVLKGLQELLEESQAQAELDKLDSKDILEQCITPDIEQKMREIQELYPLEARMSANLMGLYKKRISEVVDEICLVGMCSTETIEDFIHTQVELMFKSAMISLRKMSARARQDFKKKDSGKNG